MKTLKSNIKLNMILLLAMAIYSCSKDDNHQIVPDSVEEIDLPEEGNPETESELPTPIIGIIDPLTGPKMTVVTVNGANFGTDKDEPRVSFNGKEAEVLQVFDNKLITTVPARAYSGPITVELRDTTLVGPEFNYIISDTVVNTMAGSTVGYVDDIGTNAQFNTPTGLAVDANGNVFVADASNHRIRKISPDGTVTTYAGGTEGDVDGSLAEAQFNTPWDVDVDAAGNVYVADMGNYRIRKISPEGIVTTLAGSVQGEADGSGAEAQFNKPMGIAVTADGIVYVADVTYGFIRRIDSDGNVTTYPGGFGTVRGLAVDQNEYVYFVEPNGHQIWKIRFEDNFAEQIAGTMMQGDANGTVESAMFRYPRDIAMDMEGNILIADEGNHRIRKITGESEVTTYAGNIQGTQDGSVPEAQFMYPYAIALDAQGNVYVADTPSHKIRKIILE